MDLSNSGWTSLGDAILEAINAGTLDDWVDPISRRYCPTCKQPTAHHHNRLRRLVCMSPACPARYRVLEEAAIEVDLERRIQHFFDQHPFLRPGSGRERVMVVADDLLNRGVRPRLVLELVSAWAQAYSSLSIDDAIEAVEEAAEHLLSQQQGP